MHWIVIDECDEGDSVFVEIAHSPITCKNIPPVTQKPALSLARKKKLHHYKDTYFFLSSVRHALGKRLTSFK